MVKTPSVRHSKSKRKPITIDHEVQPEGDGTKGSETRVEEAASQLQDAGAETQAEVEVAAVGQDTPEMTEEEGDAHKPGDADSGTRAADEDAADKADGAASDQEVDSPDAAGGDGELQENREPDPVETTVVAPAEEPRGRPSLIAAGFIGGIVAVAAAGALQWSGVLPGLQPQPEATAPTVDPATEELRGELAQLSQSVSALQDQAGSNDTSGQVESALAEINEKIAELQSSPAVAPAADTEALDAVSARVEELDTALEQANDRITQLVTSGAETGDIASGALGDLSNRIEVLAAQIETVAQQAQAAEAAAKAVAGSTTESEARFSELELTLKDLEARMGGLEGTLGELQQKAEANAEQPQIARAIAAAALKSAIDRGEPFMNELETYAAVAPDSEEVAALRDLAATGVPTAPQIVEAFGKTAGPMLAASRPVPENAGLMDRLAAGARSLVQIRPVGMVEGEDVPAIIARIEASLKDGKYQAAIDEFEALPEEVRAAGAQVLEMMRGRMQADAMVQRTLSGALAGAKG